MVSFGLKHLTHFISLVPFWTPWKHQKTLGFPVFKGYRKRPLAWNGLMHVTHLVHWKSLAETTLCSSKLVTISLSCTSMISNVTIAFLWYCCMESPTWLASRSSFSFINTKNTSSCSNGFTVVHTFSTSIVNSICMTTDVTWSLLWSMHVSKLCCWNSGMAFSIKDLMVSNITLSKLSSHCSTWPRALIDLW